MRAVVAIGLVLGLVLGVAPLPAAAAEGEGELEGARERANTAAAELAEAQTRLAELEGEAAVLESRAAEGESRRAVLVEAARAQAIDRFMRAGPPSIPMLGDLNATIRAEALSGFVARDRVDVMDEFRQAGEDIAVARTALVGVTAESAAALHEVRQQVAEAEARLVELQRLDDERRAAEEARRQAEAVSRAPAAVAGGGGSRSGTAGRPGSPGSSSGSSPAVAVVTGDWVCPVQGSRAFSNDWGQPRSGGRRHQGNDILSPRGTPVVANVGGRVRAHQSGLGGISYYLSGDDGTTYYGTHLDSLSGANGPVAQGEVLGYVGNSGNASGGPTHLHFEIHPGGGGAVNPYPTLSRYC
ncbi:MAG: peptidoglycan DD-metalloendopeptidase family protein [Actinomycetota bacterium]|nr:peptidoglycan DD-metalloendopeptidase family protein [Actinomycetota bacterium]